ncbi:MAG TPA: hypothetical protein VGC87_14325 [Pyrinomonadaceae bacterium]|jgi:hypothetical protein
MMKTAAPLPHLCLALLVAAAGCGKATVNSAPAGNKTVVTSTTQNGQTAAAPAAQQGTPGPPAAASTTNVRLTQVEVNADMIDAPVEGAAVGLRASDKSFGKMTGPDGSVVFDAVPCGGEVQITARADGSDEDTILKRKLVCEPGTVDLGLIVSAFGGPPALEQRTPREMVYDANAGVWRSGDLIVPDEEVEKILSKYQSGGK